MAANRRGSILASHPAAPGLILGVLKTPRGYGVEVSSLYYKKCFKKVYLLALLRYQH